MNQSINQWMNEWTYDWTYRRLNQLMNKWMNERTNQWRNKIIQASHVKHTSNTRCSIRLKIEFTLNWNLSYYYGKYRISHINIITSKLQGNIYIHYMIVKIHLVDLIHNHFSDRKRSDSSGSLDPRSLFSSHPY